MKKNISILFGLLIVFQSAIFAQVSEAQKIDHVKKQVDLVWKFMQDRDFFKAYLRSVVSDADRDYFDQLPKEQQEEVINQNGDKAICSVCNEIQQLFMDLSGFDCSQLSDEQKEQLAQLKIFDTEICQD